MMYCVMQCINSLQCLTGEGFIVLYCHRVRGVNDTLLYPSAYTKTPPKFYVIIYIQFWLDHEVFLAFGVAVWSPLSLCPSSGELTSMSLEEGGNQEC